MKGSQMGVLAKVGSFKSERQAVLDEVERTGIIAILRGDLKNRAIEVVKTLVECGITAVEVTMNSPSAFETIRALRQEIHVPFALGAGTVLTQDEVTKAFDSGARFVVSPGRLLAAVWWRIHRDSNAGSSFKRTDDVRYTLLDPCGPSGEL